MINCVEINSFNFFNISLFYNHTNGRCSSSIDFYKSKKQIQLQPLCSWFRSWWAKHFSASPLEAVCNLAARTKRHLRPGWKNPVLPRAAAKLRVHSPEPPRINIKDNIKDKIIQNLKQKRQRSKSNPMPSAIVLASSAFSGSAAFAGNIVISSGVKSSNSSGKVNSCHRNA